MIEFRLLGTLHLTDAEGREVKSLLTRSRRVALLAYLAAATPRGFHRRDTLLALFWPELDQEHARAALRQALHVVRGSLGADVVLTRWDEGLELDVDRLSRDVVALDHAVPSARSGEALHRYQGRLPEGCLIPNAGHFERRLERGRRIVRPAVMFAAVVGLVFSGGDSRRRLWPRSRAGGIESLAVLPLETLSGDSVQGSFGGGMTEALITDLARITALRVTSG